MMHSPLWETLQGAVAGGTGWWIFSSLIGTMPAPREEERWYGWIYRFLQRVGANHSLVAPPRPEKLVVLDETEKK